MEMNENIRPYDVTEYLDSPEMIAAYIKAAIEENDADFLAVAIGDVARARGMSELARETGLSREALYRGLGENGNPTLQTMLKVLDVFGLRLVATPRNEDEIKSTEKATAPA